MGLFDTGNYYYWTQPSRASGTSWSTTTTTTVTAYPDADGNYQWITTMTPSVGGGPERVEFVPRELTEAEVVERVRQMKPELLRDIMADLAERELARARTPAPRAIRLRD